MTEIPAVRPDRPTLIAMDMDGTVAGADHVPSAYTEQVLALLTPLGIQGVVITGRSERSALGTARTVGLSGPVIAGNGAIITEVDSGERLWFKHFTAQEAARVARISNALGTNPMAWGADGWFIEREDEHTDVLSVILDQLPVVRPFDEVFGTVPIVKFSLGGSPELLDEIGPQLEAELTGMTRSLPTFYESAPPNATKADALAFVLDRVKVDAAEIWGFADGGNDVGWLSMIKGRRLAMANARDEVKAIATEVIGHHAEEGVARYLVKHLGL